MPNLKLNRTNIEKYVKHDPLNDVYFWDSEVTGFGIRMTKAGTASYVVQGRVQGVGKDMRLTIGPVSVFEPDQARDVAREHLRTMRLGTDPREERKQKQSKSITLRAVADAHFARPNRLKKTTRTLMEWHIEQVFEKWKDRPIASITPEEVRKRYNELAEHGLRGKKAAPASAGLAMITLRTLINFARTEYPALSKTILTTNVVDILKGDMKTNKPKPREGRIETEQVGAFWNWLTTARSAPGNNADSVASLDLLMFLTLTGARRNEGAMLEWRNVHLEDETAKCWWHIEDPKNADPVWFPLSSQAVAVLRARQAANDKAEIKSKFAFPSRSKAGHIMDTRAPLERFAKTIGAARLSAHDLRKNFIEVGASACGLDVAKVELLTNHKPQSVTGKHYLKTKNLRPYYSVVQTIGDWIEQEGKVAERTQLAAEMQVEIDKLDAFIAEYGDIELGESGVMPLPQRA